MSYLLIENIGEAEIAAITLMGASTKRSHTDKIGLFGTGNKYSLSVLLREGCEVTMFFGSKKITFELEEVTLRTETFRQIILVSENKRYGTNFTVEMGIKWGVENALRELISNAIDEGEFMIAEWDGEIRSLPGHTRVFVKMTPAVKAFYEARGHQFLALRKDKPLYKVSSPGIELWPRQTGKARFYRRGVLVFTDEEDEGLFDYNFNEIELAEDRTASLSDCQWLWSETVDRFPIEAKQVILENIERNTFEAHNPFMQYRALSSEDWKALAKDKIVCSTDVYDHALQNEVDRKDFIRTSTGWATALKSAKVRDVTDFMSKSDLRGDKQIAMDDFDLNRLEAAVGFLTKAGFNISLAEIRVFEPPAGANANVMGYWDDKAKTIGLNKACFVRGLRFVVETLVEEVMHKESGFDDKTRAFQSYIFTNLVNEVEKRIGTIEEP